MRPSIDHEPIDGRATAERRPLLALRAATMIMERGAFYCSET
jgi:hypothetical protein